MVVRSVHPCAQLSLLFLRRFGVDPSFRALSEVFCSRGHGTRRPRPAHRRHPSLCRIFKFGLVPAAALAFRMARSSRALRRSQLSPLGCRSHPVDGGTAARRPCEVPAGSFLCQPRACRPAGVTMARALPSLRPKGSGPDPGHGPGLFRSHSGRSFSPQAYCMLVRQAKASNQAPSPATWKLSCSDHLLADPLVRQVQFVQPRSRWESATAVRRHGRNIGTLAT